jgi:uncharacterized protein YbcI
MDDTMAQREGQEKNSDAFLINTGNDLYCRIMETALDFVNNQLGLHPRAIFVDQHGLSLMITLKNVLSDSEKYVIKDKHAAELIARTLAEAFRSVAGILKTRISGILGRNILEASLVLDATINRVSIFLEADDTSCQ